MENKEAEEKEKVLCVSFNQDGSCFGVGTEKGFRIYNTYPLKLAVKREMDGGIGIIEMLSRCNIIALVGGGSNPNYDKNKVILYDDSQAKVIREIILIYSVLNIKLERTKIFIIGENQINVFAFSNNYSNIDSINTYQNKQGIIGISYAVNSNLICYQSSLGEVTIKNYGIKKDNNYETTTIKAHQSEIIALTMNNDGTLLASASEKGTIIRIYQTKDGDLIQELRRGLKTSEIFSLVFNYNSKYLACSSSQGTVHIFCVKNEQNEVQNQKSVLGYIANFIGFKNDYLNSEWSFAQYHLQLTSKSFISFNSMNLKSIIVITLDGKYYQGEFDEKAGGECSTSLTRDYMEIDIEKDDDE